MALSTVIHFQPDIIFVSWIPCESTIDNILADLQVPMIMIGEGKHGCTGSNLLWENHDISWEDNMDNIYPGLKDVPQWDGIHDRTWLINWKK